MKVARFRCGSLRLFRPVVRQAVGTVRLRAARMRYGLNYFGISRAAANVSGQGLFDLILIGSRVFRQQRIGGHEHARRTESTLNRPMINK